MKRIGAFGALLILSCSSESSTKFSTDKMEASLHVEVENDPKNPNTHIFVFLQDGFTDLILEGGDQLVAHTEKERDLVLQKNDLNFYKFDIPNAGDRTDVTIELKRTQGVSTTTVIKVPPIMQMTTPGTTRTVSFATGSLDFEWTNTFPGATVDIDHWPCGGSAVQLAQADSFPDNGKLSVTMAQIGVSAAPSASECRTVRIERRVTGKPDPKFDPDSTTEARHFDLFDVTVTP